MLVRLAVESDIRRMSVIGARAFDDDPMWRWFIPSDGYFDRFRNFAEGFLQVYVGYKATYITDDCVSGAAWAPPGHWEFSEAQAEALTPAFEACFGANLEKFQEGFGQLDLRHPHDPHWYLGGLATHPDWQGQGLGSSVLQPILDRCDAECVPAYLEATKDRNVPFYRRHGFEVTNTVDLPAGGPTVYLMWREPKRGGGDSAP